MGVGEIIAVEVCAALCGFCFGYFHGERATAARDAKFTELGRWLADAMVGVRSNHRFHGEGVTTTSTGRAKLPNGETYIVTVELERP